MQNATPNTIYLRDYSVPAFTISSTALTFYLDEANTEVVCELSMRRNGEQPVPLELHGQELELLAVAVNGVSLTAEQFQVTDETLTVFSVPNQFQLTTRVRIQPQNNTSLEGLYKSRSMFCTQCEAEGFRKITYYLDRPDVLSVFTTKIIANKTRYPVLLSNGNLVNQGEHDDGSHWFEWHDPFPKPSYLFALVGGDLACVDDRFVTRSGRTVSLKLFVESKDLDKCEHALASLKQAMTWDENVYGREYDLDVFMIVAVDDFNMGAMENKGLNIFNTSCVLANPATTTDAGFQRVEAVVAHEYFHNWSGNRVTCRDWFQLSLKEGFTVFRDAEFSADMGSRPVKRVEDVQFLRTAQFGEDAGPMAHPVRPESFIEISNFYTLTVYEKGAEVVRMLHTLLGAELFRRGTDLYFDRHDGQAVTIEDFVKALADVSGRDFSQFMNWYSQAGTPVLEVVGRYDEHNKTFALTFKQSSPTTPEARSEDKHPLHIPVAMGLLGEAGALRLQLADGEVLDVEDNTHRVLELTEAQQTFVFTDIHERPVPSLLRGFSAPVKLRYQYDTADLTRLIIADSDGYTRWDACQQLGIKAIESANFPTNHALMALLESFAALLADDTLDPAMTALMLALPSETYLGEQQVIIDVDGNHQARNLVCATIAENLEAQFLDAYQRCRNNLSGLGDSVSAEAIALRSLKNQALKYLMMLDKDVYQSLCSNQFSQGENMTDVSAALTCLVHSPFSSVRDYQRNALAEFYQRWQDEALVVNQWFSVQASNPNPGTLTQVKELMAHPSFDLKNPNKLRSLVGVFAGQNGVNFHAPDGAGYGFLADQIMVLNRQNPQIAARMLAPLTKWRRHNEQRAALMKAQLTRIKAMENLSKDVFEVVSKSLAE